MSERIDTATLAALLDGRLPAAERQRVLADVARSAEAYGDLAEAAAVLRMWERDRRRHRLVRASAAALLAAASIAGALLLPPRWSLRQQYGAAELVRDVALPFRGDGSLSRYLGPAWLEPARPAVRGGTPALPGRHLEIRIGVLLAGLEAAAEAGDTSALIAAAAEMRELAGTLPLGGPVAQRYGRLAATDHRERRRLESDLRILVRDTLWLDAGTWLGSARMAALAGQPGFFGPDARPARLLERLHRSLGAMGALDSATRSGALASNPRAALALIHDVLSATRP